MWLVGRWHANLSTETNSFLRNQTSVCESFLTEKRKFYLFCCTCNNYIHSWYNEHKQSSSIYLSLASTHVVCKLESFKVEFSLIVVRNQEAIVITSGCVCVCVCVCVCLCVGKQRHDLVCVTFKKFFLWKVSVSRSDLLVVRNAFFFVCLTKSVELLWLLVWMEFYFVSYT